MMDALSGALPVAKGAGHHRRLARRGPDPRRPVVTDIQKIFLLAERGIVTLRGNASQIAVAKFLIPELEQAPQPRAESVVHEFTVPGSEDTVVVYGLAHTASVVSIQELITTVRLVLDINRIFCAMSPKLITMRASPIQVQIVKWLIPELDRRTANTGENEMRMPGSNDDVVHVFYLSHARSLERMNGLMTDIRRSAYIQKAFIRSEPPALVLRGTADQIAAAGRIIESGDRAP